MNLRVAMWVVADDAEAIAAAVEAFGRMTLGLALEGVTAGMEIGPEEEVEVVMVDGDDG